MTMLWRYVPYKCFSPFLITFNCVGMLLAGTAACVGFMEYFERYPSAVKEDALLGPVATKLELWGVMTGTLLFGVFATGYVAALHRSEVLLKVHFLCLAGLSGMAFCASVATVVAPFLANSVFHRALRTDVLRYFGTSPKLDRLVEQAQSKFHCCGLGPAAFRDWDFNARFRCSPDNPSASRCGVPASCCRDQHAARTNRYCGSGALNTSDNAARNRVYGQGCITAALNDMKGYLLVVGSICLLTTLILAIAAATARNLSRREARQCDIQNASIGPPEQETTAYHRPYRSSVEQHPTNLFHSFENVVPTDPFSEVNGDVELMPVYGGGYRQHCITVGTPRNWLPQEQSGEPYFESGRQRIGRPDEGATSAWY